eukprot:8135832-Pyramimonas_sp.AAC.1
MPSQQVCPDLAGSTHRTTHGSAGCPGMLRAQISGGMSFRSIRAFLLDLGPWGLSPGPRTIKHLSGTTHTHTHTRTLGGRVIEGR